jgi:hypothetical protein
METNDFDENDNNNNNDDNNENEPSPSTTNNFSRSLKSQSSSKNHWKKPKDPNKATRFLYLSNRYNMNAEKLYEIFSGFGDVEEIVLNENSDQKAQRQQAHIIYASEKEAKQAFDFYRKNQFVSGQKTIIYFTQASITSPYATHIEKLINVPSKQTNLPSGLFLFFDFIDEQEEKKLLNWIDHEGMLFVIFVFYFVYLFFLYIFRFIDEQDSVICWFYFLIIFARLFIGIWSDSSIGRRTQHYGFEFDYLTKNVDASKTTSNNNEQNQLPPILKQLVEKLMKTGRIMDVPNQM